MDGDYLRKCTDCGLEAHTEEDLQNFERDIRYRWGRRNRCHSCNWKRSNIWSRDESDGPPDEAPGVVPRDAAE